MSRKNLVYLMSMLVIFAYGVVRNAIFPSVKGVASEAVKVIKVVDGDTIEIEGGMKVRLIGVDTPETVDPKRPQGCFGTQASDFTKSSLLGKTVILEKDISETDKYGRLLRYVWLDNVLFNEQLVKQGYAQVSTYPPDVKYKDRFLSAEKEARKNGAGLWGSCSIDGSSVKNDVKYNCEFACDGPDLDCKDFSNQLQAQNFFDCCGFSVDYDPMRLDSSTGKGDGKACSSLPAK